MKSVIQKNECTGCSICEKNCPVKAITMKKDLSGFVYPIIDKTKCINCEKCLRVCPTYNYRINHSDYQKSYAAYCRDSILRKTSSSGGIFSMLALDVIRRGGVVSGAIFDKTSLGIRHVICDSESYLEELRGSKYAQSDISGVIDEINKTLKTGRKVLFCGTPCQIAAIKSFLGPSNLDNIYLVDFVCHGVPSIELLRKYLYSIGGEKRIKNLAFRNKEHGWKNFCMRIEFEDNTCYLCDYNSDPYMTVFLRNYSLRPSCYKCKYKTIHRDSDITLADCWGCETIIPQMNDNSGLSLVIVHTERGDVLLNGIKEGIIKEEIDIDRFIQFNPSMVSSAVKQRGARMFNRLIQRKRFDIALYAVEKRLRFLKAAKAKIKVLLLH